MFNPPLIKGPIPPFSNPPIEPQFFQPSVFQVSALSLGIATTVTTSKNHNYVIGQLCRLVIGGSWGSSQLNQQAGYVIQIPASNQVVLNLNSQNISPFKTGFGTKPQIIAVGDVNSGPTSNTGRQLPNGVVPTIQGSFINISPAQV